MDGLSIGRKEDYLEEVVQESAKLSLLARGSGIEVMKQVVYEGTVFYLYPGNNPDSFEFFYILEGELVCEDLSLTLKKDDYFFVKDLKEIAFFEAASEVSMIWMINESVFHLISQKVSKLLEVVSKVEEKDRYTFKHSIRVQNSSIKIGKKLHLLKGELDTLIVASVLHDVGKINVPEEILNKAGGLTDEEYDIIKKHPADGAEMVKDTYYSDISTIIHQHHERLNGSGYPDGLKDEEITIGAKIIGVSDSYDAMTDDRSYRKAYTPEYAVNELKRLSGVLYDAEVVNALEAVLIEEGILNSN
ncbi:HD domain-containing phosphohydrolase [Pseudalkalibacillus sp. NRS-1564]|uniref:HD-GYP domain-containing protein n=1 Tax=Pseudalkalibacillus sp. NRS-1564 TaxID=3233900 RepID=UPI003D299365